MKKNGIKKRHFDLIKIIRTNKCLYSLLHSTDDSQDNGSDGSCAYIFSFLLISIFAVYVYYSYIGSNLYHILHFKINRSKKISIYKFLHFYKLILYMKIFEIKLGVSNGCISNIAKKN